MAEKPEMEIVYCAECGYLPDAISITERLLKEFPRRMERISLVPASQGLFEVTFGGKLIFSKLEKGRLPAVHEVRDAVKAGLSGPFDSD